jgi:hypothetical protein
MKDYQTLERTSNMKNTKKKRKEKHKLEEKSN